MTVESRTGLALLFSAIGDPDGPADVHRAWASRQIQSADLRDNLLHLWTRIDNPTLRLPAADWVEMFRATGYICLPTNLPPLLFPLTVFRGATLKHVRSLAWSRSRVVAEQHQQRGARLGHDSRLFRVVITDPTAVLGYTTSRQEDEVILDPTYLTMIEEIG